MINFLSQLELGLTQSWLGINERNWLIYNVYISSWERAAPNMPNACCTGWNSECWLRRSQREQVALKLYVVLTADRSGWPRVAVNGSSYLRAGRTQWERVVLSIEWSASLRVVIWDWLRTALVENGSFPVASEIVRSRGGCKTRLDWVRVTLNGNGPFPGTPDHNLCSFSPPV